MRSKAWNFPLLSTLVLGAGMTLCHASHAATEWKPGVPRTAYVTLFEWSWESIAKECTNFLGPKGYAAVQVSPPQEHGPGGEWWRRYQPVSFKIASRSGDRAQFQSMVTTCKNAGVDVYVDTVINHMADYHGGTGTGGSSWTARNFPGVPFTSEHFHNPKCDTTNADYAGNRANVMNCDMPGLPDLNTSNSYVQGKIASYMKDLLSLGVAGFRIDAAKHMAPSDLATIKSQVPGSYFFTQEVIRDGTVGSATSGDLLAYQNIGTVNEFNYIYAMKNSFLNLYNSNLAKIPEAFSTWGFIPSNKATVFVNNHDTERKECTSYSMGSGVCDSLSTLNGAKLYLADIFMLAYNYGYPSVGSGYYFSNHDQGPSGQPYNGSEATPSNCSNSFSIGKWDCIHRDKRVANMVGFRNYVDDTAVANWVTGDVNQIAFSRGTKGFVAINNSANTWQKTFATGLPNGTYCNVVASDNPESGNCVGTQVVVSGGQATLSIAPATAVALHIGAKVSVGGDVIPPSKPGSPRVSGLTSTSATVSWTPSTDNVAVAGYRILRNGSLIHSTSASSSSYNLSGLTAATRYTIGIIAFDAAGNVSETAEVIFSTPPIGSATATVYYYTTSWTNVYGFVSQTVTPAPGLKMSSACTNYKVRTESMRGRSTVKVQFNNGAGLTDPKSYAITAGVNIVKNGVVTKGSNPCLPTTDTQAPSVPASLVASGVTSNNVSLSWAPSTDNISVIGYRVYRNGTLIGTTTTPNYDDITVGAGSSYSYTVTAYDAVPNVSGASVVLPVNVPPVVGGPVSIIFHVTASTAMGESVYITGNQAVLGSWSIAEDATRKCAPTTYPVWTCTVTFPVGVTLIEYKYQIIGNGNVKWESGANRSYTLPTSAATKEDGSFHL